jgi:hypothetical protein
VKEAWLPLIEVEALIWQHWMALPATAMPGTSMGGGAMFGVRAGAAPEGQYTGE